MCEQVEMSCGECDASFPMDWIVHQRRLIDGKDFHCPNGHAQHYGSSEVSTLTESLAKLQNQLNFCEKALKRNYERSRTLDSEIRTERQRARTYKGLYLKLKNQ